MEHNKLSVTEDPEKILEIWDKIQSTVSQFATEDPLNSGVSIHEKLNINKFVRNQASLQRIIYLRDRIKDLNFSVKHINGELPLSNEMYSKDFVKGFLLLDLINHIYTIKYSMLNFIAYFFDLGVKDEEIQVEEIINELALRDTTIAEYLKLFLLTENQQQIQILLNRFQKGYLNMTKAQTSIEEDGTKKISIIPRDNSPIPELFKAVNIFLGEFYIFSERLLKLLEERYSYKGGFISIKDTFLKSDLSTGLLINIKDRGLDSKSKILLYKLYNFEIDGFPYISASRFRIVKNLTYDQDMRFFYKPTKTSKRSVDISLGIPAEIKEEIFPPSEGRMIWTHTLELNSQKVEQPLEFLEEISLILSLFNRNAIFSERNYIYNSHKGRSYNSLYSFEYAKYLNPSITNLHRKGKNFRLFIKGLLRDYRDSKQPHSLASSYVELWGIIDKLGAYFTPSRRKGEGDLEFKKIIEIINKVPEFKNSNMRNALEYEHSINYQNKELFKNHSKIIKSLGLNFQNFNKRYSKAYSYRSKIIHNGADHLEVGFNNELIPYYFFVSNLVFSMLLELLSVCPQDTTKLVSSEIKGFVEDTLYYDKKQKKLKESNENFEKMLLDFSGQRKAKKNIVYRF